MYNEVGEKADVSKTVAQADAMFIEIVDKNQKKEKEKKSNDDEDKGAKLRKGIAPGITIEIKKACVAPIKDQLFPEEWQALQDLKTNYEICKNYSDEFLVSCLFARKLDLVRTHLLLQNNWKWRKENGFVNIPKLSEIPRELFNLWTSCVGTRSKFGNGLVFFRVRDFEPGKGPYTFENMIKFITWHSFVGIFTEGLDYFRNGVEMIQDLDGYGWKHFDVEFQKKMSTVWQDTFPMRVKKIIVLNPPTIFNAIVKIAKSFNKTKMMDRLEVLSSKKDLLKLVDKDNLLEHFGGNISEDPITFLEE